MKTDNVAERDSRKSRRVFVLAIVATTWSAVQFAQAGSASAQHGFGNGLTLGLRHDIIQRNDPFQPRTAELPNGHFRWGAADFGSPNQGYWFWILTNPGQLPINNMDPLPEIPPGLVYGLHANPEHLANWHPSLARFYQWQASDVLDKGYLKCHAQDNGRRYGEGLNWLVTTEEPFVSPYPWGIWYQIFLDIYRMPTGTMVGLNHTRYGNQAGGPDFIPTWHIMVNQNLYPLHLDPRPSYTNTMPGFVTRVVMIVLGFDVKFGGDSEMSDGEGFWWYEKVAQPFTRTG